MKNRILIFGLLVVGLSLMAFKLIKGDISIEKNPSTRVTPKAWSGAQKSMDIFSLPAYVEPDDLVYKIDSRFIHKISKSKLDKAKSIFDILTPKAGFSNVTYTYSRVSILDDVRETDRRLAESEVLSRDQIKLIQSTDDSENIYIRADFDVDSDSGYFGNDYLTYFVSVVPDQEAVYNDGKETLIDYLKKSSESEVKDVEYKNVKPGRVVFTITKDGLIDDVALTSTSGYTIVDNRLIETIKNMPGQWTPASNDKGVNVDQEFVFFFGREGC